jgi:dipeptidyl aminopeptidase/acylaminoacyl peptidase
VCPKRTEVLLEPVDPVNYSLPRALSPDGKWLVASRVIGTDLTLSLRRTQTAAPSKPVGSLPYTQVADGTLLVSVPVDGSQVVFGTAGTASTELDPQTTLSRWRAATGAVIDIPVPVVASPPPGQPYPVNAFAVSADGQRVLWTQSFREGPEPYAWHRVLLVTDATTDAVLSTASVDDTALGSVTGDGAASLNGNTLVATATGAVTDLAGEVASAEATFPGPPMQVSGISDNLRYLALRRYDPTVVPGVLTYLVWDRTTGTGRVGLQLQTTGQSGQPWIQFNSVTPGGSLLATRLSSPPDLGEVVESHPTAGVRTVASSAAQLNPQFSWMVSTSDGRTVVISRQSPLGRQLVVERCA